VQASGAAFRSQFLSRCVASAATVLVQSPSEIRRPHRLSSVVIILSRALASGLVGVFAHKRFSRSEQVHHSRKQHKES
jgi:hypothetical protein